MNGPENFHHREKQIAENSFSSSASLDIVKSYIGIPENVTGMYILDIGGGASIITHDLNRRGAHAYAVDPRYSDLKDLKRSVDHYLTSRKGPLNPADKTYVGRQRKAREGFLQTIQLGDTYYIAALAGSLPFPSNVFDLTFSLQTLTRFLIQDQEVFLNAVKESLRVTKPGGLVSLQPWLGSSMFPWKSEWIRNAVALRRYMHDNGIQFEEIKAIPYASPRLSITKPVNKSHP